MEQHIRTTLMLPVAENVKNNKIMSTVHRNFDSDILLTDKWHQFQFHDTECRLLFNYVTNPLLNNLEQQTTYEVWWKWVSTNSSTRKYDENEYKQTDLYRTTQNRQNNLKNSDCKRMFNVRCRKHDCLRVQTIQFWTSNHVKFCINPKQFIRFVIYKQ